MVAAAFVAVIVVGCLPVLKPFSGLLGVIFGQIVSVYTMDWWWK